MDLDDENIHYLKIKKKQTRISRPVYLELKTKTRQGKCVGAALEFLNVPDNRLAMDPTKTSSDLTYISNDVWFHLANYIAPEDVQRYALLCTQSANSINSCGFWRKLYCRYCQQSSDKKWILQLPEQLQMDEIKRCDKNTLRQRVIMALFYCHEPFKERLKTSYKLSSLEGRTCISSWHKQTQYVWIMCYIFKHNFPLTKNALAEETAQGNLKNKDDEDLSIVDDWEYLVIKENTKFKSFKSSSFFRTNDLNGISLLIICCDRFIPFPSDIVYNHATTSFRLASSRELLSTDMRSTNLELDFVSATKDQSITVKYAKIQKYKVLPWWHPDFRIFNKYE